MNEVFIKDKKIATGHEPFIMAEIGINHNGEIEKAFDLIKIAKNSGCDAVKFQNFTAEEFVVDESLSYTYKKNGKSFTEPLLDILKRTEFSKEDWQKIKRKCDDEGIIFLSTAQNESDLDLLLELGIPAIKVGSDDFNNLPLLEKYTETNLPLILSSGMANLSEIFETLETVGTFNGYPTILLFCVSEYPTPAENVNLNKFKTISNTFQMIPIGFSDHTIGPLASSLAIPLGSCIFEKHITLDRNLPGPDHWFAEDPVSLKNYVDTIRNSYKIMGQSIVRPTKKEEELKKIARRSIFTLKEIKKGDSFNEKNIGLCRPGTGLSPKYYNLILGKKASKNLDSSKLLDYGDFE